MLEELQQLRTLYLLAFGTREREFIPHGETVLQIDHGGGHIVCEGCDSNETQALLAALLNFAQKL